MSDNLDQCISFHFNKIEELRKIKKEVKSLERNALGFVSHQGDSKYAHLVTGDDVLNYLHSLDKKINMNEERILDLNISRLEISLSAMCTFERNDFQEYSNDNIAHEAGPIPLPYSHQQRNQESPCEYSKRGDDKCSNMSSNGDIPAPVVNQQSVATKYDYVYKNRPRYTRTHSPAGALTSSSANQRPITSKSQDHKRSSLFERNDFQEGSNDNIAHETGPITLPYSRQQRNLESPCDYLKRGDDKCTNASSNGDILVPVANQQSITSKYDYVYKNRPRYNRTHSPTTTTSSSVNQRPITSQSQDYKRSSLERKPSMPPRQEYHLSRDNKCSKVCSNGNITAPLGSQQQHTSNYNELRYARTYSPAATVASSSREDNRFSLSSGNATRQEDAPPRRQARYYRNKRSKRFIPPRMMNLRKTGTF